MIGQNLYEYNTVRTSDALGEILGDLNAPAKHLTDHFFKRVNKMFLRGKETRDTTSK